MNPSLQLKISLQWVDPPIWRRVFVPADITLAKLHSVIQTVMGWEDAHLHQFRIGEEVYTVPELTEDGFYDPPAKDENIASLFRVAPEKGASFLYEYDFGDGWVHEIVVEDKTDPKPGQTYPICLAGERACPPEDCGGPPGYEYMLEALADPRHPEHHEFLDWFGDEKFDPEAFDLERVNATLERIR